MNRRTGLVLAAIVASACGSDVGTARVRPLPAPDARPALRGDGPPRSPRTVAYQIAAQLDPHRHVVTATQIVRWTNPGETAVDVLPMHLYLNAFKNESTVFMQSSRGVMRGARAEVGNWGWIELTSVKLAGVDVASQLRFPGPDETVVELPLATPVAPRGTVELELAFTAQLPEVFARTGYKGAFHMVAQWFPKLGVRIGPPGAERWECAPLHLNTEFFADFATYDVSITVPSTFVVAATGVLVTATEAPGGTRTFAYRAEDVHDFVWMADPFMEVMTGQATVEDGTVEVRVVHRPAQADFARRHLQAAIGAVEQFSARLVPYPWSILTVIDPPMEAASGAGGMEYPTLVTTAGDTVFARPGLRLPEYVTVHEVGHQWFGGILASNEAQEAWLDEGLNDWLDAAVMAALYGPHDSAVRWMGWQAEVLALRRAVADDPGSLPSPIATAAHAFADSPAYYEATYAVTLRAIATLEQVVGATRFAAAIQVYARTWAFRHPTGPDLWATLARELGEDLGWFVGPVFDGVGAIEVGMRSASCRDARPPRGVFGAGAQRTTVTDDDATPTGTYVCEIVVTNTGRVHLPLDVEAIFEDGSTLRLHWNDRGGDHWERFEFERSSPLAEVHLDPDRKLALTSPVTHHYRLEPDGAAALRAGAWVGSVTHTLMQLVGP